jgi:hypothetical protein
MDTLQVLGAASGLGLLAGIRLYATVFALGVAIRMGWFELSPPMSQLAVISETPVLIVSGLACMAEFVADKVPWFDSVWDSIHTFIRPAGAAALGVAALGTFDSTTNFLIALLTGGIAFTSHASKAATRVAINHSPEPFSNMLVSFAEDAFVPLGLWLFLEHPIVALVAAGVFLVIFALLSFVIFRLLRRTFTALRARLRGSMA